MSQLDFFIDTPAEQPASATLMAFPLARRRKLVVKAASDLLSRKTQEGREKFWARLVQRLTSELRRCGTAPADIEAQLMAFHRAVGGEVEGRDLQPMSPNGAA